MIPKVDAALLASSAGVQSTIVDGREPGALRAVLTGSQIGTRLG